MPAIIQSTSGVVSGGTTIVLTLPSTPTPGNTLYLCCGISEYAGAASASCPGFVSLGQSGIADTEAVSVLTRVVQSGDGKTYTVTLSTFENHCAGLAEVVNAGTPTIVTATTGATTTPANSTPAGGWLALAMIGQGQGSGLTGVNSPYTVLANMQPAYHQAVIASLAGSGAGTTSATFTGSG